jgi:integrase
LLTEKKTGKARRIVINAFLRGVLKKYLRVFKDARPGDYLFCGRDRALPLSRVRAWKIVKEAAGAVGVEGNISCHSLRKTFGYHAWKKHIPVAVIMEIFNHSSFAVTRRYLGIGQEELDRAQESVFTGWRAAG